MRKLVCPRLPQFQACVSPLGQLHTRPLFGGYSLAIDDTVFAMVAEGNIYLKACEQSAAYRVEHRNPLLTLRRHGRIVPLKYYQIDDTLWRDEQQLFRLGKRRLDEREQEHQRRGEPQEPETAAPRGGHGYDSRKTSRTIPSETVSPSERVKRMERDWKPPPRADSTLEL